MKKYYCLRVSLVLLAVCITATAFAQLIVAHRGASFDAPENTLASFQLAWEQGADAIEADFHLTADKQIVCIHDKDTQRVSGVDLKVAESTLAELRKLDVGSWKDPRFASERIVTLREVLKIVPSGKQILIEIKCGPEILPHLKQVLQEASLSPQQTIIICFNKDVIRAAKQILPSIEAYWLIGFPKKENTTAWHPTADTVFSRVQDIHPDGLDFGANKGSLQATWDLVNPDFVSRCSEMGLSLHAWTVDDPELAMQLSKRGFRSVTTNRPEFLRKGLAILSAAEAP